MSGAVASGKTTLAKLLANYFNKSAYIDTDQLKWFIQRGFVGEVEVEKGIGTMKECLHQHIIAINCTGDALLRLYNEGYNVFIADLVYTEAFDKLYDAFFSKCNNARIIKIHLSANFETLKERSNNLKQGMTDTLYRKYIRWFDKKSKKGWNVIDTNNRSLQEVFDKIITYLPS